MGNTRIVFVTRMSAIGDVIIAARVISTLQLQDYYPILVTSPSLCDVAKRIVDLEAFVCFEKGKTLQFYLHKNAVSQSVFQDHVNSLGVTLRPLSLDLQRTSRSRRAISEIRKCFKNKIEKNFSVEKRTFYRIFLVLLSRLFWFQKVRSEISLRDVVKISTLQENAVRKIAQWDGKTFQALPRDTCFFEKKSHSETGKYPYVCLFPGASGFIKMWPKENFRKLIRLILEKTPYHVLICGSQSEEYLGEYLDFPKHERVHNQVNKTNLGHILDLISHAKYVVTNDSFAAHASSALQIPATVIFGATSPKFGFLPNSDKIKLEYQNLTCSPCSRHGKGTCRFKNLKCLRKITPQSIFESMCEATQQGACK